MLSLYNLVSASSSGVLRDLVLLCPPRLSQLALLLVRRSFPAIHSHVYLFQQMRAHQLEGQRQSNEFLLKRVEELEQQVATTSGKTAIGTD